MQTNTQTSPENKESDKALKPKQNKLIGVLCKRLGNAEKPGKVSGIAVSLIYALSPSLMMFMILDSGIAVSLAVFALIAFAFIRFRLYRYIFCNTLTSHIVAFAVGKTAADAGFNRTNDDTLVSLLPYLLMLLLISASLEFVFGIILSFGKGETHTEHFTKGILYTLPLYFTIFLYIPSETFLNNINEFLYTYADILPHALFMTAVFTLSTALMTCGLGESSFLVVTRCFAGLTIAVYCQYMFMNSAMPKALLGAIDWKPINDKAPLNAVIWLLILLLPFAAGAAFKKLHIGEGNAKVMYAHSYLCIFLFAIQLVSLVTMLITCGSRAFTYKSSILSGEEQYTVSSKTNVITFIVDMADRHHFDDTLAQHPEKKDILKDFTCYTNTCMVYDSTVMSVPQMLSGTTVIPEDGDLMQWYEQIWNDTPSTEFYSRLHENGYTVNLFGIFLNGSSYDLIADHIDNDAYITKDDRRINVPALNKATDKLAAFRYLPLGLKKLAVPSSDLGNDNVVIFNKCDWSNADIINNMQLKLSDSDKDYFIVQHIEGNHEIHEGSNTEEGKTLESLELLDKYMQQLKELGVYDDSVIIITSDHGTHCQPDATPIFYIKQPNTDQSETQFCSSPIYHTDYLATCLDSMGLEKEGDEEIFGRSIYDIPEDEKRQRLVFQRYDFLDKMNYSDSSKTGYAMYGFYYTGTREDLEQHEINDPPDMIIYMDANV